MLSVESGGQEGEAGHKVEQEEEVVVEVEDGVKERMRSRGKMEGQERKEDGE